MTEKANKDFNEKRKEFWAFVGRTSKGNLKGFYCFDEYMYFRFMCNRYYDVSIMKGWVQHLWMISLMKAGKSI